jgi:YggT family protein
LQLVEEFIIMEVILRPLLYVTMLVLDFLFWVLLLNVILSWLTAFGILNNHNRIVDMISELVYRITEPFLRPIRRVLPPMGGIDLSSFVLFLGIIFLQKMIGELMYKL